MTRLGSFDLKKTRIENNSEELIPEPGIGLEQPYSKADSGDIFIAHDQKLSYSNTPNSNITKDSYF